MVSENRRSLGLGSTRLRRPILLSLPVALLYFGLAAVTPASAQGTLKPPKIGILTDMSSTGSELSGQGSVIAAQMAVEDYQKATGRTVDLIWADSQAKPDIATTIARKWFDDQGVDVIADLPPSSVALAVQQLARERKKILLFSTAGALDLVGRQCSPTGFQWVYNAVAVSRALASAIVARGGKSWYFVVQDIAYGQSLEQQARRVIEADGGSVVGVARVPTEMTDFASVLLQAQSSPAQVIALGGTGTQGITSIKQAREFGIGSGGKTLVGMALLLTEVRGIGLDAAQGLLVTDSFYWDMNDRTRAWAKRFGARDGGRMPTSTQAGIYSAIGHYLAARDAAGTNDGPAVAKVMHERPVDDFMTDNATIQPNGWVARKFYLFEVKKPSESTGEWDVLKLVREIPAAEVAPTDTGCASE